MSTSRRWYRPLLVFLLLIGLAAAAVLAVDAMRPPRQFRIAAGAADGMYHAVATRMSKALAAQGIHSEVLVTAGSVENLSLLKSGQADFGVIQGGVAHLTDTTGLSTVAMIGYEPVWIIVNRASFDKDVAALQPQDFRNKRIGIGAPGSGIQPVAREILAKVNVADANAVFVEDGMANMATKLRAGELDAAFFVTPASNPIIQDLVRDPALGFFQPRFGDAATHILPYLNMVVLHRGQFDLENVIPAEDTELLATRIGLVAREGAHPDLVRLLLTRLPSTLANPGLIGERDEFPTLAGWEIPPNPDAVEYFKSGTTPFERYLPFEIASPLSRLYLMLLPLVVLAVPAWSLIKNTYKWYTNNQVLKWYPEITAIDRQLDNYASAQVEEKIAFLDNLDTEIARRVKVSKGLLPAYFDLRTHINYVMGRLQQRREELSTTANAGADRG